MIRVNKRGATVRLLCAAMIIGVIVFSSVQAESPQSWQGLTVGEFAVGFQTIEKFDHSRSFRATRDYFGNPVEGETSRPVQLCIWYPAVTEATATRMIYGQYAFPYPEDDRFFELLTTLQNRELQTLGFMAGQAYGKFRAQHDIA